MSFRVEKISSILKTAIGGILLNKMNDPDLRTVSVSGVTLSGDLKTARIHVSSFDPETERIMKKLDHASGFIRRELSRSVYLKFLPDLQFVYDAAFEFDQKKSGLPADDEQ